MRFFNTISFGMSLFVNCVGDVNSFLLMNCSTSSTSVRLDDVRAAVIASFKVLVRGCTSLGLMLRKLLAGLTKWASLGLLPVDRQILEL